MRIFDISSTEATEIEFASVFDHFFLFCNKVSEKPQRRFPLISDAAETLKEKRVLDDETFLRLNFLPIVNSSFDSHRN